MRCPPERSTRLPTFPTNGVKSSVNSYTKKPPVMGFVTYIPDSKDWFVISSEGQAYWVNNKINRRSNRKIFKEVERWKLVSFMIKLTSRSDPKNAKKKDEAFNVEFIKESDVTPSLQGTVHETFSNGGINFNSQTAGQR